MLCVIYIIKTILNILPKKIERDSQVFTVICEILTSDWLDAIFNLQHRTSQINIGKIHKYNKISFSCLIKCFIQVFAMSISNQKIFVSVRCDKNTYELDTQAIAILYNAIFIPLLILILAVAKNCTYYFGITRARNIAQFQKQPLFNGALHETWCVMDPSRHPE